MDRFSVQSSLTPVLTPFRSSLGTSAVGLFVRVVALPVSVSVARRVRTVSFAPLVYLSGNGERRPSRFTGKFDLLKVGIHRNDEVRSITRIDGCVDRFSRSPHVGHRQLSWQAVFHGHVEWGCAVDRSIVAPTGLLADAHADVSALVVRDGDLHYTYRPPEVPADDPLSADGSVVNSVPPSQSEPTTDGQGVDSGGESIPSQAEDR